MLFFFILSQNKLIKQIIFTILCVFPHFRLIDASQSLGGWLWLVLFNLLRFGHTEGSNNGNCYSEERAPVSKQQWSGHRKEHFFLSGPPEGPILANTVLEMMLQGIQYSLDFHLCLHFFFLLTSLPNLQLSSFILRLIFFSLLGYVGTNLIKSSRWEIIHLAISESSSWSKGKVVADCLLPRMAPVILITSYYI